MKRLGCLVLLALLTAGLFLTAPGHWFLGEAGTWLDVGQTPERCDLIVALGGSRAREEAAARLFHLGLSRFVFFSGPDARSYDYRCLDIPESAAIPLPPAGFTTWDEAKVVRAIAVARKLASVTIVTETYHSRRALWTFRRAFAGTGISVRCATVPEQGFHLSEWWRYHMGVKAVVMEYAGLVYYQMKALVRSEG